MNISHNLLAMNAQRQYKINTDSKKKSTEKLSSGYRINRAADDAAGLTISEKMRSQIRGLDQGVKNCQDGISMCQIGDGALEEVQEMLHRLTELSVKSANGSNTQADRDAIQQEVNQILKEIDKIDKSTEFNTLPIFGKGNSASASSSGAATPSYIINDTSLSIPSTYSPVSVSAANINTLLTQNADGSYELQDGMNYTFASDVTNVAFHIGSGKSVAISNTSLESCNVVCESSELYIKNLIIDNKNGVSDAPISCIGSSTINFLGTNKLSGKNISGQICGNAALEVTKGNSVEINGNGTLICDGSYLGAGIGGSRNKSQGEAGTIIINSGIITAGSNLNDISGVADGIAAGIGGARGTSGYGGTIIINGGIINAYGGESGAAIGTTGSENNSLTDVSRTSIFINGGEITAVNKCDWSSGTAGIGGGFDSCGANVTITGGNIYASGTEGGAGIGSGPGLTTGTGVNELRSGSLTISGGHIYAEGSYNTFPFLSSEPEYKRNGSAIGMGTSDTIDINSWKNNFGSLTIDGITEDLFIIGRASMFSGQYVFEYREGEGVISGNAGSNSNGNGYWIHAGARAENGFYITFDDVSTDALGIKNLDVSTQDNARRALSKIDGALANVSANRSHIGAQQNRLEHTIRNEDNIVENTTAAESLIRDTDMAAEMVNLTKQNILSQVGESMISQANQTSQGVLTILGS